MRRLSIIHLIMNSTTSKTTNGQTFPARVFRIGKHCFSVGEQPFVFMLSGVVGVVCGVMAWLLKMSIGLLSHWLTRGLSADGPDWRLAMLPVIGVMLVVALKKKWFKGPISHGVRVLKEQLKRGDAYVPAAVTFTPVVSAALTLGFGGSAGAEGPIAYSGAAVASWMSRRFGLTPRMALIMVGCGAGAGIAAIFKAPIGGALFTLEVLRMGLGSFGVMVLFVTTLIAGLTATGLQGFSLDMVMREVLTYDTDILPWAVAFGIFCGLYSVYYSYIMDLIARWLGHFRNLWIKGAVSGILVGVALLLFPALYGEGYSVMGSMLNGDFGSMTFGTILEGAEVTPLLVFVVGAAVLLVKCFVTSLSYNGGGVTGEFAPTLFAGCFAGYVFAAACNLWLGVDLPVSQFAFIGMAGVMAGAIKAPMMAMFIIVEMSSAFTLLLPIAIAASISFGIVRVLNKFA